MAHFMKDMKHAFPHKLMRQSCTDIVFKSLTMAFVYTMRLYVFIV